jgi:hypothetical protein
MAINTLDVQIPPSDSLSVENALICPPIQARALKSQQQAKASSKVNSKNEESLPASTEPKSAAAKVQSRPTPPAAAEQPPAAVSKSSTTIVAPVATSGPVTKLPLTVNGVEQPDELPAPADGTIVSVNTTAAAMAAQAAAAASPASLASPAFAKAAAPPSPLNISKVASTCPSNASTTPTARKKGGWRKKFIRV